MKKNYLLSAAAFIAGLCAFAGCDQDLMTYSGEDLAYFDVRWGVEWLEGMWAHQYYSTVPFGAVDGSDYTLSNIDVRVAGLPSDKDRTVRVVVNKDSTDLVSGTEFDPIDGDYIVKAGEEKTTISITFHHTERMMGDTLKLQLMIAEGEGMNVTRFPDYDDENHVAYRTENPLFDYNHDAQVHNIFVYDTMVQPTGWWGTASGGTFGLFSAKKWRLLMEVTGTVVSDYKDKTTMTSPRALALGTAFAEYLYDQVKKREPVIDENGCMMWVNAVSDVAGTAGWSQTTKWEDYSKIH